MVETRLKVALGIGLVIGAVAVGVTLSGSPIAVARVNTATLTGLGDIRQPLAACQSGEVLPRGSTAIRLRVFSFAGPRVTATVFQHGRPIAHGERGSGWSGGAVTVPVAPLATTRSGVELCYAIYGDADEADGLVGEWTTQADAAFTRSGPLLGRLRAEYMRPGSSSWWSLATAVAHRLGLGRAASGSWWAVLAIALMGCVVVLCSWQIMRGLE
jgi:hypothetical protein